MRRKGKAAAFAAHANRRRCNQPVLFLRFVPEVLAAFGEHRTVFMFDHFYFGLCVHGRFAPVERHQREFDRLVQWVKIPTVLLYAKENRLGINIGCSATAYRATGLVKDSSVKSSLQQ